MPPESQRQIEETQFTKLARQAEGVLRSRYGIWLIAMISFVESALPVPIITDPFMMVYIMVNRTKTVLAVVVTTISSLIGGIAAYLMATSAYYFAIQYLSPESVAELDHISAQIQQGTFVMTILGAITPVPYTLVALGAGFVQGSLLMFILGTLIGRGLRYAVVGYVTYAFGPAAIRHIKRNVEIATLVFFGLVLAYLAVHFWL